VLSGLVGILRQEFPEDTVISFSLYADDDVTSIINEYLRLKSRKDSVIQEGAGRYARFLSEGTKGMPSLQGVPVRNFRLFVSVKAPELLSPEVEQNIHEGLAQAQLGPRRLSVGDGLAFFRKIFNERQSVNPRAFTSARYLRDQVIAADSPLEFHPDGVVEVGGRFAACITPKSMPEGEMESLSIVNRLIGGYEGVRDDSAQLTQQFLWTTSVFFRTDKGEIARGANMMLAQRSGGTVAKVIGRRVRELDWVLDDIDQTPYCNVITSLWVFAKSREDLTSAVSRAEKLWEKRDFIMQRETDLTKAMLIASLPFGLYVGGNNVKTIDRDFRMSIEAAARLLPVQSDFAGYMRPALLYVGRKGQLAQIDVFDPRVNNHNFLVCANSGAGKSFQTNYIVQNYFAMGAKIRITDIGYSYQKQCMISKGRFIDIGAEAGRICLNPFASYAKDDDDRKGDETALKNIILTMIFSATGTKHVKETQ
jgi:conjugal transfer ATP-binding protein TraC